MAHIPRLFIEGGLPTGPVTLTGDAARRLSAVMRVSPGDALRVFAGDGREFEVTISAVAKGRVSCSAAQLVRQQPPHAVRLELWAGLVRAQRMDTIIEKCTEAGADIIRPLITEHAARGDDVSATRTERWRRIAIEAAEQSGRLTVPAIGAPVRLATALEGVQGRLVVASQAGEPMHKLAPLLPVDGPLIVVIGPEGGLSEAEEAACRRARALLLRLGPNILRTETAAIVATAVLRDALP